MRGDVCGNEHNSEDAVERLIREFLSHQQLLLAMQQKDAGAPRPISDEVAELIGIEFDAMQRRDTWDREALLHCIGRLPGLWRRIVRPGAGIANPAAPAAPPQGGGRDPGIACPMGPRRYVSYCRDGPDGRLDRLYKLHEMLIWNYNMVFEVALGYGVKETIIEYSEDGLDWTTLGDMELVQGACNAAYTANNVIPFDGAAVKYVRMTIGGNFGGSELVYGLSEVRFMYIPVYASQPAPVDGAANVAVDGLLSWVAGSPEYASGYVGQATSFNGVNDSVVSAFAQEVRWPACSVSFWAKAEVIAQAMSASAFNNNSSVSDFQIDLDGTNPGNYRYHGSADVNFGPVTTEWVHLATSCDGVQTSVYYNGLHAGRRDVADTNIGQIAFGVNRAGDVWFNGLIDEARIYDRPLSAGEVAALAGITEAIVEPFQTQMGR